MPVALHVAADDGSVEHVHRRKQGRRPVPLVVVGHGSGAAFLERQAGLGSVERLDLALFVDAEHDGVRRGISIEPNDVAQLLDEGWVIGQLNCRTRCGWSRCARQMRCTELTLTPAAPAIAEPVQCVASCGGASMVSATTRSATEGSSFGMREGRVLSRKSPPTPSAAKRSCQRQTQVLDLPVSHMIAFVPAPRAQQYDLRPPDMLLRCVAVFDQSDEPIKVGGRDGYGNARAHADSHAASPTGIPLGIQMSERSLGPRRNRPSSSSEAALLSHFRSFDGGRARARTLDPLIKSATSTLKSFRKFLTWTRNRRL